MKRRGYQKRFYRGLDSDGRFFNENIVLRETDLQIYSDKPVDKQYCLRRIGFYRRQIELYVSKDERFLTSLKPIAVENTAHPIVREMALNAKKANVGPMAAVAGAIAQFLGKDLLRKGCKEVIIENGGDLFIKIKKPVSVGIYAGRKNPFTNLRIKVLPRDTPLGICTSSGKIGHSLSFGLADAVVIMAKNACLADAAATATANQVSQKIDLERAVGFARSVSGVCGAVIILKKNLASWGNVELA